jgi:enoyl-CoA hydratase/carnithine racemase
MPAVRFEIRDHVATATLDRPAARNAIDLEMMAGLRGAIETASADTDVKVLVIAGDERAFSAGVDLALLQQLVPDRGRYHAFVHDLNALLFELEAVPVPTIAVVDGFALAGGVELLLACDFALAATEARIGDQHANFGLMPGAGATQRLTRRIGAQRAKELLFTGRWLSGAEAADIGLVLRAVPRAALEAEVAALAADLVAKSRTGLAYTKRAVRQGEGLPLRAAIDQETFALFEFFAGSATPHEGMAAFVEKRPPVFPD